jgi:hypothetical protein
MFASRGFKAALFFLTIALMLGFQSHHLSNAEQDDDSVDGASCSATATGWNTRQSNGLASWTAWAGFSARLSKEGRNVGDSVKGSYDIFAYMPGPHNGYGKRDKDTFTLRITRLLFWVRDGTTMGNVSQIGTGSGSGNPGGRSTAEATCGGASTKTCRWP